MFWKKKKTAVAPAASPAPRDSFFSTSIDVHHGVEGLQIRAEQALKKSIQRTIRDSKVTTSTGDTAMAMDEAYPDLQLVKAQNSIGGAGIIPLAQLVWFTEQAFIGYQTCALIAQNWLIDKACTMPARDAVRHGYEMTVNDGSELKPEVIDYIRTRDKDFKIKDNCVEFVRMGRVFGIRIALFEVLSPDPKYYENPFNIDGVTEGSYKGISQIDPYWITPELDQQAAANPASKHFYEPTWWRINGKRVHRTHLCINRNGDEMPDILKPTYFYGGVPIPQKIAERVYAAERTANEAPMLAMTKRLITLQTDITKAIANADEFAQKMAEWTAIMNNYGVKIVGEDEMVETHDTSLTDLDETIMTQFQLVAAAAEVPATKLLGTSPKGFGASGEYEESSYHEFLESIQEHDLSPLVNRHHALLMKSEVMKKFSMSFVSTDVTWKPTDTPTDKEQAEINLIDAQRDLALVQAGAIDGTDVRMRIIADPDSGYSGIEDVVEGGPGDREAQQEAEGALEQAVQESNKTKGGGDK